MAARSVGVVPGATSANSDLRIFLESMTYTYLITNATNAPIEMDFYDIEPRRDTSLGPVTVWNSGMNERTAANGGTAVGSELYGGVPEMSAQFKKIYRVTKKTRVLLPAGGFHKHTGFIKWSRWVPQSLIVNTSNPNTVWAGYTHATMIALRGYPISDTTASVVTTAASEVLFAKSYNYKYRWQFMPKSLLDVAGSIQQKPSTDVFKNVVQSGTQILTALSQNIG